MNVFLPHDPDGLAPVALLLAAVFGAAFALARLPATEWNRVPAWSAVIVGTILADRITLDEPAGFRMLALIAALLIAMKGVVCVESRLAGQPRLCVFAWFAFAIAWLGMRPVVFANVPGPARPGTLDHLRKGTLFVAIGFALAVCARWWSAQSGSIEALTDARRHVGVAAMMVAFSLVVHFGLCELQAGWWRMLGADCRSLFRAPLRSTSLKEFWGSRWNVAFSEMTALAVYRPLKPFVGTSAAATAAFLFSGLLHEIAISVPVRAGYGLPLAYFALHALAMRLESRHLAATFHQRRWLGRIWTLAWIVLPLPLLFHPWFVQGVIVPLLGVAK
ncbi:MAG: MBOAT family protein [Planctomycetaceae bacterium]